MGYDPNDPNQGSQAPLPDQSTPDAQATNAMTTGTVNDLVRSRPAIAAWLASHRNGQNLNNTEKSQLAALMQQQGVDPTNLEVDSAGTISWPKHTGRDIAVGSLLAFGPVVAAWAIPAAGAAAGGGAAAAGGAEAGAAGAGTAAGVEAGVTAGLGSAALPGAGTALGGASGVLGSAGAVGGAFDAAGNFIGDSSIPGATGSFTGGSGGGILGAAQQLAGPLSAIASGRAQGAQAEAGIGQSQDRNAISLYGAENAANASENNFNLGVGQLDLSRSNAANNFGLSRGSLANSNAATDLAQRNFALTAPGKRAGNAVRGDILSNAQDVSFSGLSPNIPVPQISGGLRPSMFSADTRALGKDITSQARTAQAKGDTFAPLPDLPTYQAPEGGLPTYKAGPAAPTLTGLPSGGVTSALGNASSILSLAPAFADIWKNYQQYSR